MLMQDLRADVETIVEVKRKRLASREEKMGFPAQTALAVMKTVENRPNPFLNTVTHGVDKEVQVIGQIRLAKTYDPVGMALRYNRNGVDAVSMFTDDRVYSKGLDDLLLVSQGVKQLPVIVQDYVLSEFHVAETRAAGASGLIAYASLLERVDLRRVVSITQRWQMTSMVQVDKESDLQYIITLSPHVLCIGSENDFNRERDVPLINHLRKQCPHHIKVMPFGVLKSLKDVEAVLALNIDAVIVDESLILNTQNLARLFEMLGRH